MAALEGLTKIERLALEVVLDTPAKQNKYASDAKVGWNIIKALEAEFTAKGFNIAAGRARAREIKQEVAAERYAARHASYAARHAR